ncbi:uncharacterized protein LOC117528761 [Thalassophryne amazonica]|uniref:uncharacterized protein LOC117528761 n=1 Tax=Thalassophryne amazonica TaxID=390379 RepID=UPI001471FD5B|nr:uncharacterized protein LOC117528761 [Thalassophryne amazonica]
METVKSSGDEPTKPKTPVIETTRRDSDLLNSMTPESNSSTKATLEDDSQANETERNIAPLITEFLPATEVKMKHETQVVDKDGQMQEVETTKTVPEEAMPQAKEVSTADVCISEEIEVADEAIQNENKYTVEYRENETQGNKRDQEVVVGDASPVQNVEDSIVMEDTATVSYLPSESSFPANTAENILAKNEVLSPLILNKAEVNETEEEIMENECKEQEHETKEEHGGEETEEWKDWTKDAGKAITTESDVPEDLPIPRETGVFLSSTKPEICLSPLETTTIMNMTNQVFCPIEPEGNETPKVPSLDLCLSPNDSDTCLSPVEGHDFQTLNDEDEEACLNLTEAKTTVKPVEKFILVTKELSLLNRDREVPEEDRVITEVKDKNQFCINVIRSNNGDNLNSLNIDWRPISCGRGVQSSNHVQGGLSGGIVAPQEEIPSKKEHSGFSGLYRESVRKGVNVRSFKDQYEDRGHPVHGKGILSAGASPKSNYKNLSIRGTTGTAGNELGVQRNNDLAKMAGNTKSGSFGSTPAAGTSSFGSVVIDAENKLPGVDSESGIADSKPVMAANMTGIFSGMVANSAGTVGSNVKAGATTRLTGRVRHGGREWIIYSGSPGRVSSLAAGTGNDDTSNPSVAAHAAENPSPAPIRRSNSVGNGELVTFSDRNSGFSLPRPGSKKQEATATTGLQGRIKYGSGEWNVYGGNPARRSSLPEGLSSPSTGCKEQIKPLVDTPPAKCPPAAGRFSSGDWAVYGSSLGHSSSPARGFSTSSTGSEENANTQVYTQQGKSTPTTGRFSIGDWAIYGGSPGHSSSLADSFSPSGAGSEENANTQMYSQQGRSTPPTGRDSQCYCDTPLKQTAECLKGKRTGRGAHSQTPAIDGNTYRTQCHALLSQQPARYTQLLTSLPESNLHHHPTRPCFTCPRTRRVSPGRGHAVFHLAEDTPVFHLAEHTPVFHLAEDTLVFQLAQHTPAFHLAEDTPVFHLAEDTPVFHLAEDTPVFHLAEHTPVFHMAEHTPVFHLAEDTPMFHLAEHMPVFHLDKDTPVFHLAEDTPVFHLAEDTPVFHLAEDTPVFHLAEHMPMFHLAEDTPVFHLAQHTPVFHLAQHTPVFHLAEHTPMFHLAEPMPVFHLAEDMLVFHLAEDTPVFHLGEDTLVFQLAEDTPAFHLAQHTPVFHLAEDMAVAEDTPVFHLAKDTPVVQLAEDTPVFHLAQHTPVVHLAEHTGAWHQ